MDSRGHRACKGGEPIQVNHSSRLPHSVPPAPSVARDYSGEQCQDACKLRHGPDEVRPACPLRAARAPHSRASRHIQHSRHLQGSDQVQARDREPEEAGSRRPRHLPLLFRVTDKLSS